MMTDPISDMLTRVRNAITAGHEKVSIPSSNIKVKIAEILKEEGYISNFKVAKDHKQGVLKLSLKYYAPGKNAILGLKRVSKPGRRSYMKSDEIPKVLRGLGIAIVSTNKGILTDSVARKQRCGGEVLCYVW